MFSKIDDINPISHSLNGLSQSRKTTKSPGNVDAPMRLYLINPTNPLVNIVNVKENRWNRYRVWKPLSLMVLAGLTPPEWEISIIDENLGVADYASMSRPDLVGITAFTSQATRAYEVATYFQSIGVPVVMGGIHATMCLTEAMEYVDSVVTGEAEAIWPQVLADCRAGKLNRRYDGGLASIRDVPLARHDLLPRGYEYGAVQTTRGCPLNCSFCSVTAFNGAQYRPRPIADVVQEFQSVPEKRVLVVDDNLIGTRRDHIDRAKDLFRAIAQANLHKQWIAQVTINFADDEELLTLAARAGCRSVLIGFESPTAEGLKEVNKRFNLQNGRDFRDSVRRIQRHNILVVGSFIIGLDIDRPGVGRQIADAASQYGVDSFTVLFLTPLPGTRLWEQMKAQDRIALKAFPGDWKYYTLGFPVAHYKHFSMDGIIDEAISCDEVFLSTSRILRRVWHSVWHRRHPLITMLGNFSFKKNSQLSHRALAEFKAQRSYAHDLVHVVRTLPEPSPEKTMKESERSYRFSEARSDGSEQREPDLRVPKVATLF